MNIDMKKPKTTNDDHFQRSAMAPVGIVRGGVHEDHLEQEQREDADVVDVAAQEEALRPEQPEVLAEEV